MTATVHPADHDDEPVRRGRLRAYLEVRGLIGGHRAPHAHVDLRASDGVGLASTYLPGPATDAPALVLLHGFAAHRRKPSYARLADHLSDHAHVLSLDLRGHGRSRGETTLGDREVLDIAAAVDWLRAGGHDWVGLVGASMGATSAVHAASSGVAVEAVVTISAPAVLHDPPVTEPMRRLRALWDSAWGRAGLRWLLGVRVVHPRRWQAPPHPLDAATRIEVPLLVVHGRDDSYFPASDARDLAAASPDARLWLRPDGFGHAEDGFSASFCRRLGDAVATVATTGSFPDYEDGP